MHSNAGPIRAVAITAVILSMILSEAEVQGFEIECSPGGNLYAYADAYDDDDAVCVKDEINKAFNGSQLDLCYGQNLGYAILGASTLPKVQASINAIMLHKYYNKHYLLDYVNAPGGNGDYVLQFNGTNDWSAQGSCFGGLRIIKGIMAGCPGECLPCWDSRYIGPKPCTSTTKTTITKTTTTKTATTTTTTTCNAGCIPKDVKLKKGQALCCKHGHNTNGHETLKCPGPAHYHCGD